MQFDCLFFSFTTFKVRLYFSFLHLSHFFWNVLSNFFFRFSLYIMYTCSPLVDLNLLYCGTQKCTFVSYLVLCVSMCVCMWVSVLCLCICMLLLVHWAPWIFRLRFSMKLRKFEGVISLYLPNTFCIFLGFCIHICYNTWYCCTGLWHCVDCLVLYISASVQIVFIAMSSNLLIFTSAVSNLLLITSTEFFTSDIIYFIFSISTWNFFIAFLSPHITFIFLV